MVSKFLEPNTTKRKKLHKMNAAAKSFFSLKEIVHICGATHPLCGQYLNIRPSGISTDTRTIQKNELFIALRGEHFDGQSFLFEAQQAGACAVMTEKTVDGLSIPQIQQPSCLKSLGKIAARWRKRLAPTVIGVTGSNGKTSVKDMLRSILDPIYPTWATPGNWNNLIGLSKTLLGLTPKYSVAVVELGANACGEIAQLCRIAYPEVAVITNAGFAHIGKFGNLNTVAKTKGEILHALAKNACAILNKDDAYYPYWTSLCPCENQYTFSIQDPKATVYASGIQERGFTIHYQQKTWDCYHHLCGIHNVANILCAFSVAVSLGVDAQKIVLSLRDFIPPPRRLTPRLGVNDMLILDDTYNANPSSLNVALEYINQHHLDDDKECWLALGNMEELGKHSEMLHAKAGLIAKKNGIHQFFTVGKMARSAALFFGDNVIHFHTRNAMATYLKTHAHPKVILLVKGSRSSAMCEVVDAIVKRDRRNTGNI